VRECPTDDDAIQAAADRRGERVDCGTAAVVVMTAPNTPETFNKISHVGFF
jgi:hypothetical protein